MKRIFLVGFMGSGKSTVGRNLAEKINWDFVDLDEVIEKREGLTISQIFEEKGEEYFRNKEALYLRELSQKEKVVVATGGGAPCFSDNMSWMNEHGLTIYLKADAELLLERLKAETISRPLLKGKSEAELRYFIKAKMQDREPFYSQAKHTIPAGQVSYDELAERMIG